MRQDFLADRRDMLVAAIGVVGGMMIPGAAGAAEHSQDISDPVDPAFAPFARDWDWLVGSWSVRHRRLRDRLAGSTRWDEFSGTCSNWPLMHGQGNVDDNVLDLPSGRYRGVGVRAFNVQTRQWAIWWIDSRTPGIEPPVLGGFAGGVGTFTGDDTWKGRPVKVRYRWTKITPTSANWDQASSPDGGATWETNWHMDFTRTS